MIPLVKDNLDAIAELRLKHKVRTLELFGSAACGDFGPDSSDIGFLVGFRDAPAGQGANRYFGLLFDLQQLLGTKVDLAEVGTVTNRSVIKSIEQTKVPVYAAA